MLSRRQAGGRATDWTQCGAARCKERSGVAWRHGGLRGVRGLVWLGPLLVSGGGRQTRVARRCDAESSPARLALRCGAARRRAPAGARLDTRRAPGRGGTAWGCLCLRLGKREAAGGAPVKAAGVPRSRAERSPCPASSANSGP